MNILLINRNAGSLQHGMEFRPYYFAREWLKAGHKVTIVAGSFSHYRQKNIDCDSLINEQINGIDYLWLPICRYSGNGMDKLDNMHQFVEQLKMYQDYLVALQADIVIDANLEPLSSQIIYDIAKKSNAKYIAEIHDLWEQMELKVENQQAYIAEMKTMEEFRCAKADKIISALPKLEDYLASYNLLHKQVWYIPNGVSLVEYKEFVDLTQELRLELEKYKAASKLLIGYAGTMDTDKALYVLVEAARRLSDKSVQFILLGDGQAKAKLKELADDLDNITFLDSVSKNMVHAFLRSMDCLYAGWQKNSMYRYGISYNKITEYMFAGKMIIHSISASNDLVAQVGCGISVPAENVEASVEAVQEVLAMPEAKRLELGAKGRDYVARQLNYRALANWYLEVCRM